MIRHYLQMAFRSLRRDGLYTWVNLIGLAIGFAVASLIALYVLQESRFDRFHSGSERIYRIAHDVNVNNQPLETSLTPGPLAVRMLESFPEVEAACRFYRVGRPVASEGRVFFEESVLGADPECLEMFALPFVAGELESALAQAEGVVLTEVVAEKYFGEGAPLGRELKVGSRIFTVTGVVEDVSARSHLRYDLFVPIHTQISEQWIEHWSPHIFHTYVRLRDGAEEAAFAERLDRLVAEELGPRFAEGLGMTFPELQDSGQSFGYFAQPLEGIHLDSHLDFELQPNGDRRLVRLLAGVALLILLIAGVNYVNLTTSRASKRILEVGLRKALGAERRQLIVQFLCETLLTTFIAALLSLGLLVLLWKPASRFIDGGQALAQVTAPATWGVALAVLVSLALLAGLYPALVLSSFRPLGMLRTGAAGGGRWLRRVVLAFQFCVAITLLVCFAVIHLQLDYLQEKDLGFEPAGLVAVMNLGRLGESWPAFKEEVLRRPQVRFASATSSLPGLGGGLEGYLYPGQSTRQEDLVTTWVLETDPDFVETAGLRLVEGKDLAEVGMESQDVVLVSTMVIDRLGWSHGVGDMVTVGKVPAVVQGVFDDLHMESLHKPLQETVIRPLMRSPQALLVRAEEGSLGAVLPALEKTWKSFAPEQPFVSRVIDEELRAQYASEATLMRLIEAFTLAAVLLTCLGILGLSAYSAERRRREIGIRKSLGAPELSVVGLLSREFLWLLLAAFVFAVPLALRVSRWWLDGFVLDVGVSWWLFPATGAVLLGVTLLVVAPQALHAAHSNPADSLREP